MRPLWAFAFIVVIFSGAALYVVNKGIEPSAIRILNPTNFDSPEALGQELAKRFYNELQMQRHFIFGDSQFVSSTGRIWEGFMSKVIELGVGFENEIMGESQSIDALLNQFNTEFKSFVRLSSTAVNIEAILSRKNKFFAIFVSPFAPDKSLIVRLPDGCDEKITKYSAACLSRKVSSGYFRRRMSHEKFGAMMEQIGQHTFVLYVWEPQ